MDLTVTAGTFLAHFAEDVTYQPNGGTPRSIRAVVDRRQPSTLDGVAGSYAARAVVSVRADSELGITPAELDLARDQLVLPLQVGGTPEARQFGAVLAQDNGLLTVEVR